MGLKVLDLFAGTGSATAAFRERGHEVIHIEKHPAETGTPTPLVRCDILDFAAGPDRYLPHGWRPDIIWASPPCTVFSLAGKRSRWEYHPDGSRTPADDAARLGVALVKAALSSIETLRPRYWWMENPRAGLRTMPFMRDVPGPTTVWYCRYGDTRAKPTDLWGRWPATWTPHPECHNGHPDHEAAPRGSKTGTQGIAGARDRGVIPHPLSLEICLAAENAERNANIFQEMPPDKDGDTYEN